jgi:hypothetical protein
VLGLGYYRANDQVRNVDAEGEDSVSEEQEAIIASLLSETRGNPGFRQSSWSPRRWNMSHCSAMLVERAVSSMVWWP